MLPPLPPEMVIIEEDDEQETNDFGILEMELCIIKEKNVEGEEKTHIVFQMPAKVPDLLLTGADPKNNVSHQASTYNILMADVSGSMFIYWNGVMTGWNEYVAPHLVGRTNLFVFGSKVELKRSETNLINSDFANGQTDLTGALQTIVHEVYQCKERYIKVFLITDGHHNTTLIQPSHVIDKMNEVENKICEVFVLGVGCDFPVQYSLDIRSRLHNGSTNMPSLFWAKTSDELEEEMKKIGGYISDGTSPILKLSVKGFLLPGGIAKDKFYLNEWVYFPCEQEQVKQLRLIYGNNGCHISPQFRRISLFELNEVFRQWNSVIIQINNKKEPVPSDVLPLMERILKSIQASEELSSRSIRDRLEQKEFKKYELELRSLLNKIRVILTTEKFQNEKDLAETILSTTVRGGKYETKCLQMKGHSDEDYRNDCKMFMEIYEEQKKLIMRIKNDPDDYCQVTMNSTISDLQDRDFPTMLNSNNKYEFLKLFTISGIPVYTPHSNSVTINPWSYSVRSILKWPYTIMSQVAIEKSKVVELVSDNNFNAIIPIFSQDASQIMAPLMGTRLYAMCATYAITKNPYIIDFDIHMAALGVTWMRILFENPTQPRPEFVRLRIAHIEATATSGYLHRPSFKKYWQVLINDTAQALMTESFERNLGEKPIKCESLIKPMFILYLHQRSDETPLEDKVVIKVVRMILLEYIGRCLSKYKKQEKNSTPFTDFFAKTLVDEKLKEEWVKNYIATSENLTLKDFYTLEEVEKTARKHFKDEDMQNIKEKLIEQIPIAVDMKKVEKLRDVFLAGDISWFSLRIFAKEVGLKEDVIDNMFNEHNVFIYTAHALQYRDSRERLTSNVSDNVQALVTQRVHQENCLNIYKEFENIIVQHKKDLWLQEYLSTHREIVRPMTRSQILIEASGRGVQVTNDTFEEVYKKYRPNVGLLGNACQCRNCPFYLIPSKRYNQHLHLARHYSSNYPHHLHSAAYFCRHEDIADAIFYQESISKSQLDNAFIEDLTFLLNIYQEMAPY